MKGVEREAREKREKGEAERNEQQRERNSYPVIQYHTGTMYYGTRYTYYACTLDLSLLDYCTVLERERESGYMAYNIIK